MRASPKFHSFGDCDGGESAPALFMCASEVEPFYRDQAKTHCRISKVRFKGSDHVWELPRAWIGDKHFAKTALTVGALRINDWPIQVEWIA